MVINILHLAMEKKESVSIVVSAYNEEENIERLYNELSKIMMACGLAWYEILFVNDGSLDKTFEACFSIALIDENVKVIDLERNFGHEIAMTAGLDYARGEAVIFMDADLQHPPAYIPQMIEAWKNGSETVLMKITDNEQKSAVRKILVSGYYSILNFMSDVTIPKSTPDFRLIGKRYIEALKRMNEQERMFRGMLNWLGTKNTSIIEFKAPNRKFGKTKYNFSVSLKLALNSIIQFSIKPLRLATYIGAFLAISGILFASFTLFKYFVYKIPATGMDAIVMLILFFAAIQFVTLGIIGEYIGRIHLETKRRPLYFARVIQKENDRSDN